MTTKKLDKNLNFSLNYNWWTSDQKKTNISKETRIEYVMKYGTFEELLYIYKNIDLSLIEKIFNNIKKDIFHWNTKRQFMISYLLKVNNENKQ